MNTETENKFIDSFSCDVYRFYLENYNDVIDIEIRNVISWDSIKLRMTKKEMQKLSDFMNNFSQK